jgi:thioredoxin 1
MSDLPHVNEGNFKSEVLASTLPVLLEFGATWCQPCKQMEPLLVQLVEGWQGRVKLLKVDVDEAAGLAQRFGVQSVPTVLLFIGGKPVERLTGLQPKAKLLEKLSPHLPGGSR